MKSVLVLSIVIYMATLSSCDTESFGSITQQKSKSDLTFDRVKMGANKPQIGIVKENDAVRMPNPIMSFLKPGGNMEAGGSFGGVKSGCADKTREPFLGAHSPIGSVVA